MPASSRSDVRVVTASPWEGRIYACFPLRVLSFASAFLCHKLSCAAAAAHDKLPLQIAMPYIVFPGIVFSRPQRVA